MELYLHHPKKQSRPKIDWTAEMIQKLREEFPLRFNKELAAELNVGWRSLVRKARQLGIDKEPRFLDKNRDIIIKMAVANNRNKYTGCKGWSVPNSAGTRFKKGDISIMTTDLSVVEKVRESRNETIRREKIRIKYGMRRLTKLNLKNV